MENRENALTGEERKVIYLCNGEAPCCESTLCYKTQPSDRYACKYTRDVRHALNFRKVAGTQAYYEIEREEDQKKQKGTG